MVDTLVTNIKEEKKKQQKDDVECQVNDSFFPKLVVIVLHGVHGRVSC